MFQVINTSPLVKVTSAIQVGVFATKEEAEVIQRICNDIFSEKYVGEGLFVVIEVCDVGDVHKDYASDLFSKLEA